MWRRRIQGSLSGFLLQEMTVDNGSFIEMRIDIEKILMGAGGIGVDQWQ
jgi:hypothetical protein